jgi:hypothetical protein
MKIYSWWITRWVILSKTKNYKKWNVTGKTKTITEIHNQLYLLNTWLELYDREATTFELDQRNFPAWKLSTENLLTWNRNSVIKHNFPQKTWYNLIPRLPRPVKEILRSSLLHIFVHYTFLSVKEILRSSLLHIFVHYTFLSVLRSWEL